MPGHLLTLLAVLLHNTLLSKLACSVTLLLVIAFAQYLHRSAWYAAGSALSNIFLMVVNFAEGLALFRRHKAGSLGLRRVFRFLIIPLLIGSLFALLYASANSVFMGVVQDITIAIGQWFRNFFSWFSIQRLLFLLLGLFITGSLLLRSKVNSFSSRDIQQQNQLVRKKHNLLHWKRTGLYDLLTILMGRFASGVLALRNENTVGVLSLALLNGLLLCINVIDIVYVWFGFTYRNDMNLSAYVHEGAGLLIFSIVLAMLVLLLFFRGNLNFYKRNHWLRYGAYLWIVQNAVLVVSVLIRDYYYFLHMGMAYKRIGVVIFLILVMAGLITMLIKIHYRKSNYYLLRVNAWVAIVLLVLCSGIHWDEWIVRSNLERRYEVPVDVNFLLTRSDKTLPLIEQHKEVLEATFLAGKNEIDYMTGSRMSAKEYFEMRKQTFFEQQAGYSWLSWNVSDAYVKKHLRPAVVAHINSQP